MDNVTLREMFERQHRLQVESFGKDPCTLGGEELVEFIRWNVLALEDELHEALAEVSWKPWSSAPREVRDPLAYGKELVDAFHFLMNLVLAASPDPTKAADVFTHFYFEKANRNAQRQEEGYTGLDKCAKCHRDRAEAGVERMVVGHTNEREPVYRLCCKVCAHPIDLEDDEEVCPVCRQKWRDAGTYTSQDVTLPDGRKIKTSLEHCGACHAPVVRSGA